MKQGTTTTFNFHFNIDLNQVDSIDFFFHCDRDNKQKREPLLTKTYPTHGYEQDGVIYMPLKQEETAVLPNKFYIEPQINFIDKSSTKAHTKAYNMEPTIYTHFIDENQSSGKEESIDISFDVDESIMLGFDYNGSINKPKINGNELVGNKIGAELDLQDKLIAGVNITIAADGKTISAKNGGKFIIVEELPEEDIDLTAIYLLPREDEEESNIYDEYIYIENISEWEKIGSTEVNLDNYYTKDEVNSLLDDKQDTISATGHISINNNVITTESNKVYTAIMKNGSISQELSDYPNLDINDIAMYFDDSQGRFRLWLVSPYAPSSIAGWSEINYNTRKVYEKTTDPITTINTYEHYQIGDIWVKNNTDAWLLVNITVTSPPSATATWIKIPKKVGATINNHVIYPAVYNSSGNFSTLVNDYPGVDYSDVILDVENGKMHIVRNISGSNVYTSTHPFQPNSITDTINPPASIQYTQQYFIGDTWKNTETNHSFLLSNVTKTGSGPYTYNYEWIDITSVDLSNYYTKTESDNKYQLIIDSTHKVSADNIDDSTSTNKFVTSNDITNWNGKVGTTDYPAGSTAGVIKANYNWFNVNSVGIPSACLSTYDSYQSAANGVFIGKGTLENVITGKQLVNQTDLSSKQDTIDSTHKLSADNVDDTSTTNQFVTSSEKTTWNGKADNTTISTDTSSTTVSLTLADNHEYRYTQDLSSLTLTMPNGDFIASVVFSSGSTPTQIVCDSGIKWSGEAVDNNVFTPEANTVYNILFWYDGININAIERGVV